MAIARESYQTFESQDDPYNASCTIPANTTCIVCVEAYYDDVAVTGVSLGVQNFTIDFEQINAGGFDCCALAHLFSPSSTGAQTISLNRDGTRPYGGTIYMLYYSGTDTSLRDTDSIQTGGSNTLTFSTQTGDMVVCGAGLDADPDWTNATEINSNYYGSMYGSIAQCAADGTSEAISLTNINTGWGGIVLQPAAGGGASSTPSSTLARGIAVGMFKGMGIGSGQYP